jgi:aspartate/methionine/tyrosine aminotransferase
MSVHFSGRLRWPAQPNSLALIQEDLRSKGRSFLDFSASNPTRVGLPSLFAADGDGIDPLAGSAKTAYVPDPRGLASARNALAEFYGRGGGGRSPLAIDPGELFLCASTSEAYGWLFKLLCDPGDAILVPRPGYPLFDYLAGLESVEARPYRLEYRHPRGWRIDLESLESGLSAGRARAIVLINPNNPTGSYVSAEEGRAVIALCARYGAAIIADEVFFGFPVEAEARRSFLGEDAVLVFVLDGLSKLLGLPQAKLGWIAASGPRRELAEANGRLEIIADSYLSAGTSIMCALPALLARADRFGVETRARIGGNMASLHAALEWPDSPHRLLRCEGGWTAIIEAPRLEPEEELAAGLLRDAGLWSQPGYFFDMEREAFFTASLILQPEILAEGVERYLEYFRGLLA